MSRTVGIGIAGLGTVGGGVVRHLRTSADVIERRTGLRFEVRRAAVRDPHKSRGNGLERLPLTTRPEDLIEDSSVEVVVELMGGISGPLAFVRAALEAGKPVVTGNKALLAEHGPELFDLAAKKNTPIYYEAAVAGGIPIIQAVKEAFIGNRFLSIHGILNGTSNYILTRMSQGGMDYDSALREARELGYAEADPSLDVNGWDAAHKAIILASLAYGFWISPGSVLVRGIESLAREDVRFAAELGYEIKLLATIKAAAGDAIEVRVCPTLIPRSHVLASVHGVFNAVRVLGDVVGEALFYGRGAGQDPTSSSVLADLVEAGRHLGREPSCTGFACHELYGRSLPNAEAVSKFYLRLMVEDRPGVLAQIAGLLGGEGIGISAVIQPDEQSEGPVPLILMIHDAPTGAVEKTCRLAAELPCVRGEPVLLHVERFA
ncbi:MAG: homoserine dehydrogenase [Terrimicrobiaceae bacterium]|nr:homoserine dehydrogenase [Terrimicrobiaceae bacterium]